MKITYEFDSYDDVEDLQEFQNATKYASAIHEVTFSIRNFHKNKVSECATDKEKVAAYQDLLNHISKELTGLGYCKDS